jgi:hypothetical protein
MIWVRPKEEGRAASKSPHFLSISQQAVSADKNSAVGNITQYLNLEYLNKHI